MGNSKWPGFLATREKKNAFLAISKTSKLLDFVNGSRTVSSLHLYYYFSRLGCPSDFEWSDPKNYPVVKIISR